MFASVQDPANPTTSPVTALYNSPQNAPVPSGYIGLIASNDSRIAVFNTPSPAKLAGVAIAAGIEITSTSTPALNGTYPLDPASQANINAVITYILLNGTFPNNAATLNWYDISGTSHTFPSIAEFKAFSTATANYVTTVIEYGASGGTSGSLPALPITIA